MGMSGSLPSRDWLVPWMPAPVQKRADCRACREGQATHTSMVQFRHRKGNRRTLANEKSLFIARYQSGRGLSISSGKIRINVNSLLLSLANFRGSGGKFHFMSGFNSIKRSGKLAHKNSAILQGFAETP